MTPHTSHRVLAALAAALLLAVAAPARAQSGNPAIDKGVALYKDLEYEKAITALDAALATPGLATGEITTGELYLALSHLALRHEEPARAAFRALLDADRDFVLPESVSQTARDLFDDVKRSLPPPPAPAEVSATAAPASPREGATVTVSARVTDPAGRDTRVIIHHRVRGQSGYSTITAQRAGDGWSAAISGAFVKAPAVEYWVAAVDASGAEVATAGSAEAPLVLVVGSTGKGATPVWGKWWFWAGTGVVVAGVVGGALLLSGGGSSSNDATVIITVDPPQ